MIKIIALVVVLAIVVLLGIAATKPNSFRVERSIRIKAPAASIFPYLNDFGEWKNWSPWAEKDPDMQDSQSGSETGVGSIYEWSGNKEVGQGRMEITDASPVSHLRIKLDFLKPFEAHNIAEFELNEDQQESNVSWILTGPNPFMAKIMSVFVSMDKMVGKDFEQGLANLKALVENDNQ